MADWRLVHAYREVADDEEETPTVINGHSKLSEDEHASIISDMKNVRRAATALSVGHAMTHSRNELMKTAANIGLDFLDEGGMFLGKLNGPMTLIKSNLLSLCAHFRTYIAHQKMEIIREFGRDSNQYKSTTDFVDSVLENNGHFDFMNGMRNFILHVEMPLMKFNLHSEEQESVTLRIDFDLESLLDKRATWPRRTRRFIKNQNEALSLWTVIKNWDEGMSQIMRHCETHRVLPLRNSINRIRRIREEFGVPEGGQIGLWDIPDTSQPDYDTSRLNMQISWIDEADAAVCGEYIDLHEG